MVSVLNVVGVIAGARWPVEVTDTVPLMDAIATQRAREGAVAHGNGSVGETGDAVGDGRAVADEQRAAVDAGGAGIIVGAAERLRSACRL